MRRVERRRGGQGTVELKIDRVKGLGESDG